MKILLRIIAAILALPALVLLLDAAQWVFTHTAYVWRLDGPLQAFVAGLCFLAAMYIWGENGG